MGKEERTVLAAARANLNKIGSSSSSALSNAGSHTVSHRSGRSSHGGSHRSHRRHESHMSKSASAPSMNTPDDLSAIVRFPLVDKEMITARVKKHPEGKEPKIKMVRTDEKAMWWPGLQRYIKYEPVFSFDDPPQWTPNDILKPRR